MFSGVLLRGFATCTASFARTCCEDAKMQTPITPPPLIAGSRVQIQLEPTFPLDAEEIRRRIQQSLLKQLAPFAIAGLIISVVLAYPLGMAGCLLGLGGTAFGLRRFFKNSHSKVEARVIIDMIRESNQSQDRQLREIIVEFQRQGMHAYAVALGKFLLLKQRVEGNLHQKELSSLGNQNLDNLIDRICSLTCDHLWKLGDLDGQIGAALTAANEELLRSLEHRRVQILIHVQRAYSTLYECLDMVLGCRASLKAEAEYSRVIDASTLTAMDKAIAELEQENLAFRRLTQRVRADLALPPAPSELFGAQDTASSGPPPPDRAREPSV